MGVKRVKVDLSLEKQILCGLILSDRFLREVLPLFSPDFLEIKYASIVADWCKNHFQKYDHAPGILIQDIFETWKRSDPNAEQVIFVEGFLATLSDEYEHAERFNAEYLIDKTVQYFKARSLKLLAEDITYFLDKNDVTEAENSLSEYRKVDKILSMGLDPHNNMDEINASFSEVREPLFVLPGALGKMMNSSLTREAFIMLLGPEKRGKSWWLQFLGMKAHSCGCNVAEFQVGDMSKEARIRRQHIALARKSDKEKYCKSLLLPILDCDNNQRGMCTTTRAQKVSLYEDGEILEFEDATDHIPCSHCSDQPKFKGAIWYEQRGEVQPLTWREAWRVSQDYLKKVRPKGYRLSTHSMYSINVEGICRQLDLWEQQDGFIPDVIIIDYKDILAPEKTGTKESRDQKNETSMALRRLSQDRHVCLISACQADAASYYLPSLTKSNFSEDKRIFGHVTAMYSLNQTIEDKRKGLMRIGELVVRDDDYDEAYQVHVGQALAIGAPYLFSW